MIYCNTCTHYHHNSDQHLCDAGIFEVRISGSVTVVPIQDKCNQSFPILSTVNVLDGHQIEPEIIKKRGRPAKNARPA